MIQAAIRDLSDVYSQVQNSLDFAELTKKLQQERVSVALNFLIKERESKCSFDKKIKHLWSFCESFYLIFIEIKTIADFDNFIERNVDVKFLKSFTTQHTFNETDQVLQNVVYWPKISKLAYFKSKLVFQIQHSLFRWGMKYALYYEIDLFPRNKIQEGNKKIGEVLEWYEEVNSQTLNYVTFSIHDSDISDFYRYVEN